MHQMANNDAIIIERGRYRLVIPTMPGGPTPEEYYKL